MNASLCKALDYSSRPLAMATTGTLSALWAVVNGTVAGLLDAIISGGALVLAQAIYRNQLAREEIAAKREDAEQKKVNALVEATPGADNALAGIEDKAGKLTGDAA